MLEGTETPEKSTRSRFGVDRRSRYSDATRPAIAEASSRSMVGPRGRTRIELGASRSSAGSLVEAVRLEPRASEASCQPISIVPSWFGYCMYNWSNTTGRHARVRAGHDRLGVEMSGWGGSRGDRRSISGPSVRDDDRDESQ